MFGKRVKLFTLLGFDVKIDASWIFLAVLITWSLAVGFFPVMYEGLSTTTYWTMGVVGALGLFVSIVFHEFCHSMVGRHYGMPIEGITLFIFGGVAEMEDEPPSAKTEFLMAIAGPLSSYFLAAVSYAVLQLGQGAWPPQVAGVLFYLAMINAVLATFNLVPAFPLDGGRVFRSILWHYKGSLRWATRMAARSGTVFGYVLIGLGLLSVISGNFVGGIWWFLIGMFLQGSAKMAYRQLMMKEALAGQKVRRFMNDAPVSVAPDVTVQAFVDDYVYKHHFKMYPVTEGERLVGCVTTRQVKDLPREEWAQRSVRDLVQACSRENTIGPDADAMKALSTMSRTGNSRLMVVEGDRLLGVLALKDLMQFFNLKMDLEGDDDGHRLAA